MLWRFSFASHSTLENLLSRETPPSMEELLDEQDILAECKAQNNRLIQVLSKEDSVKSLLQWVVAGLEELDQQSRKAGEASYDHAVSSPELYPSYRAMSSPLVPAAMPPPPTEEPEVEMAGGSEAQSERTVEEESRTVFGSRPGTPPLKAIGLGEGLDKDEDLDEGAKRQRYSHVATEILTADLWTVKETMMAHKEALLRPFWDAVLLPPQPNTPTETPTTPFSRKEQSERDRARDEFWSDEDEELERRRELIRGNWAKVNADLLLKRPLEMMRFIQSYPAVLDRFIANISSPSIHQLLITIISSEETIPGVIEWLSSQNLLSRLIELLSPEHAPSDHIFASELMKTIITVCAPTTFNPQGGNAAEQQGDDAQPTGARDNRLVRELVSEKNMRILLGYMLDPVNLSDSGWMGVNDGARPADPSDPFIIHPLPSVASASSSLAHICHIIVELIRRNNSDFSEPHLFHTLRNRLLAVRIQQQEGSDTPDEEGERQQMEDALIELSSKMGIVHLGSLLEILTDRFARLDDLLIQPRLQARLASDRPPMTPERFRIVELYAELLHSSNMSIMNRSPGSGPQYSGDGVLSGGLPGVEALGEAIEGNGGAEDGEAEIETHMTEARDFPVSSGSTEASLADDADLDDGERTPGNSPAHGASALPRETEAHLPPVSQEDEHRMRVIVESESGYTIDPSDATSHAAVAATTVAPSVASEPSDPQPMSSLSKDKPLSPGDRLKQMYIQHRVLPTVVDLFFEYPANDFLHHVVYDLLQQVLNGRLGPGMNRELIIELIKEARLIERVLDAHRLNERMTHNTRTPRLPYMGHIILIAEELARFLSRCPDDLYDIIEPSFVRSEWDAFADGPLEEIKNRDSKPLAGGKPMPAATTEASGPQSEDSSDEEDAGARFGEPLQRMNAGGEAEDEDGGWGSGNRALRRMADSSDEEEDADWFRPSSSTVHREDGSDDEFGEMSGPTKVDFDSEAWGDFSNADDDPFADSHGASSSGFGDSFSGHASGENLTPHDWANNFDREFQSDEREEGVQQISMPTLDDSFEEPSRTSPGNTWVFAGEPGDGEDLPPTFSPDLHEGEPSQRPRRGSGLADQDLAGRTAGLGLGDMGPFSPTGVVDRDQPLSPSGPIPIRSPSMDAASGSGFFGSPAKQASVPMPSPGVQAYSPPEASLLLATNPSEPLGPGVAPEARLNEEGLVEREVEGRKLQVPADEIALGVGAGEDRQRRASESEGEGGDRS